MNVEDPNLDPHSCMVRMFTTEQSPRSLLISFLNFHLSQAGFADEQETARTEVFWSLSSTCETISPCDLVEEMEGSCQAQEDCCFSAVSP